MTGKINADDSPDPSLQRDKRGRPNNFPGWAQPTMRAHGSVEHEHEPGKRISVGRVCVCVFSSELLSLSSSFILSYFNFIFLDRPAAKAIVNFSNSIFFHPWEQSLEPAIHVSSD